MSIIPSVSREDYQDTVRQLQHNQDKLSDELAETKELLNKTRHELDFESLDLNLIHSIDSYVNKVFFVNSTYKGNTYLLSRPFLNNALTFYSICVATGGIW